MEFRENKKLGYRDNGKMGDRVNWISGNRRIRHFEPHKSVAQMMLCGFPLREPPPVY